MLDQANFELQVLRHSDTLLMFRSSKQGQSREILCLHCTIFFWFLLSSHSQIVDFCALLFFQVINTIRTLFIYSLVILFDIVNLFLLS